MDDCTKYQQVEKCLVDMARCGRMYAQNGDEKSFAKACVEGEACPTYCKDEYDEERGFKCELYCCDEDLCN